MTNITPQGHIRDVWREKPVSLNHDGYARLKWKGKSMFVHRIVYYWFNESIDSDMEVNHKDGNRLNNKPENLEQLNRIDNMRHSWRELGRKAVNGNAKIEHFIAEKVRLRRKAGAKYSELMLEFGLSKSTISYICNNKIWK